MKILGRKEIDALIETKSDYCISIFMPVHRLGDQQDSLRYKNLLAEAEKLLTIKGMRSAEAVKLLEPEKELAEVAEYWMNMGADGLAVFCTGDMRERYPLPRKVEESVTVAEYFRVKPLIPLITGTGRFFVLALNKINTRLFLGSRFSMIECGLPEDTPASIDEALRYDDPQKQLQYHTGTAPSSVRRGAMFHGHGVGKDEERENTIRFFQQLAGNLYPVFHEQQIPVVLVGVESLPPLYREQDNSGLLVEATIDSNPEAMTGQALHEMAWQKVSPFFAEEEKTDYAKFADLQGTGKTSTDIAEILPAADNGRVEVLFVAENSEQWGLYNPEEQEVEFAEENAAGSADLFDLAVSWILKNGGSVYVKKQDEMPGSEKIAALMRY